MTPGAGDGKSSYFQYVLFCFHDHISTSTTLTAQLKLEKVLVERGEREAVDASAAGSWTKSTLRLKLSS